MVPGGSDAKSLAWDHAGKHNSAMAKRKKTEQMLPKAVAEKPQGTSEQVAEVGGRKGPEPTRYGDWEVNGRCVDF